MSRGQSIDTVVALLGESRRPLIVAGMGAHRAAASRSRRPGGKDGRLAMTSGRGRVMFHAHPYSLAPGELAVVWPLSHDCGRRPRGCPGGVSRLGIVAAARARYWAARPFRSRQPGGFAPADPALPDVLRSGSVTPGVVPVDLHAEARLVVEMHEAV